MWEMCDTQEIDRLLRECDDTSMEMPNLEAQPHLLISKVRKHYLEYIVKLLSMNYENKQKLVGKNIHLPSAIWRCAKYIELNAAQACMVVELYRKNVVSVIKLLKADTMRGKLNRQLLEYLQKPPENEKKLQVNLSSNKKDCNCQCTCIGTARKRLKLSASPRKNSMDIMGGYNQDHEFFAKPNETYRVPLENAPCMDIQYQIPVITNPKDYAYNPVPTQISPAMQPTVQLPPSTMLQLLPVQTQPTMQLPPPNPQHSVSVQIQPTTHLPPPTLQQSKPKIDINQSCKVTSQRMSIESQDSEDQVMLQLEQLFKADSNDLEDDIFGGGLYDDIDFADDEPDKTKMIQESVETANTSTETAVLDSQAAKLKSIDERLALLESAGILNTNITEIKEGKKGNNESPIKDQSKPQQNKWLCEQYFQKLYLLEKIDQIREFNRRKHARIKHKFLEYFGEDSDDEEEVMSPMEERPEFLLSCKERMAPWIVKLLTPYYVKGRIKGKALFKALARHLIRLIYQCSLYPSEYEVHSFVSDFLKSHKVIRSEADFKEFRIENI